ncbi:MAG: rod shape-determining protein MreC [Candidatus Edwardsbacteria bacterium]|nr:rod shape-determining protein MreC [Candidatus Edwardsbacteria bacterium]MBU1576451.1 rod shape-determining protein MreC [Candidatus Edwardsbacteria bacterium]MBU2464490.1 rod shape-determining protein MreC [Candidatus Edwardsbacteria bacterium]MBU2594524.1 rod shape-determining protein MreC [Candidatus Edwardsbacteria bacterium]
MLLFNRRIWHRHDIAVLIAALMISAVLAILPSGLKKAAGGGVVGTLFAPLEYPASQVRSLFSSWKDNQELRLRLAVTSLENISLKEAARENDEFRKLLELKSRTQWRLMSARVVGREPAARASFLVVEPSDPKDIRDDMPVVSDRGLLGKVVNSGPEYFQVSTIFDQDSRVSAIVARSRVLGIFRTDRGQRCILDRVSLRSDVREGDTVLTSGYGQVFPSGLMLGTVERIRVDKRQLTMNIEINPSLDLNRISQMFIITGGVNPPLPSLVPAKAQDSLAVKPRRRALAPPPPKMDIRLPQAPVPVPDESELPGGAGQ